MNDQEHKQLVKSTAVITGPTILSRILGYLRDMLQAFYLGTSTGADAFTIAYIIPNLLRRLMGEGALTAAFIPTFTQIKKKESKDNTWNFANTVFYNLVLIAAGITILGIIFSPFLVKIIAIGYKQVPGKWELTTNLTRIMFPYIFFISLAALCMSILNSFFKFAVPASTPVLFNIAIIVTALVLAQRTEEPAFAFAIGVVIGGVLQLAFQIPFLWRLGMKFKPNVSFTHPAMVKIGKLMVPGIFGLGISQINLALSRMLASLLAEGSAAALYYATRVRELTLGLFSIALSIALLPTLSEQAAEENIPGMKKTLIFSLKLIILITIPAFLGLLILAKPIIQVLFERGAFGIESTSMTVSALVFFSIGLPFISGCKILTSVFYSLKDTKTPVIIGFFIMIIYLSSSFLLMHPLAVGGIALALSIAEIINFFALWLFLEKKIGFISKKEILLSISKVIICSGLMGLVLWSLINQIQYQQFIFLKKLGFLVISIIMGLITYFLASLIFNWSDLKSLKKIFLKKSNTEIE
ncbi:MAG: murein biosynthesis integral membrane protein MurJ [Candidatus Aminicenantia bacterium]